MKTQTDEMFVFSTLVSAIVGNYFHELCLIELNFQQIKKKAELPTFENGKRKI